MITRREFVRLNVATLAMRTMPPVFRHHRSQGHSARRDHRKVAIAVCGQTDRHRMKLVRLRDAFSGLHIDNAMRVKIPNGAGELSQSELPIAMPPLHRA